MRLRNKLSLIVVLLVIFSFFNLILADDGPAEQSTKVDTSNDQQTIVDPWDAKHFRDTFIAHPEGAFSDTLIGDTGKTREEKAWETIEEDPDILLSNPQFLRIVYNKDPARISKLINENPHLLSNTNVLNEFDLKAKGNLALLNDNPAAKQIWMKKKFNKPNGITMVSPETKIVSYDGKTIKTETASFNPKDLPSGIKYEIQEDGTLKPKPKFGGALSGNIIYDPVKKVLVTDAGFVDKDNNNYQCSNACAIVVNEDGTVEKFEGEGKIGDVSVKDLDQVYVRDGIIYAQPLQEDSSIAGVNIFGTEEVAYNPEEGVFTGDNFQVKSITDQKMFKGSGIEFFDSNGNKVATLVSGETNFGGTSCSTSPCLAVDPEKGLITVSPLNSQLKIDLGDTYKKINVGEITDDSLVKVIKGQMQNCPAEGSCDNILVSFNKNGMRHRKDFTNLGITASYEYTLDGKKAVQSSSPEGDELCIEEKCEVTTNLMCVAS